MKKARKFWQFRNAADDSNVGELLIYGIIGDWLFDDVNPKEFKKELDDLGDVEEIRVFINSDGGDVFAGQAIHSMLKRHKAKVSVYIDGLAASIASVVAMAGDTVYMPKNAMMMIHNPWTIALGDANEFREMAEILDKVRESIIIAYQQKSDLDREEIIELLDAETWMSAEEAVEKGFADEIEETKKVAALFDRNNKKLIMNDQEHDLSRFHKLPQLEHIPEAPAGKHKTKPSKQDSQQQDSLSALLEGVYANEKLLKRACDALNELLERINGKEDQRPKQQRLKPLSLYEKRLQVNEKSLKFL